MKQATPRKANTDQALELLDTRAIAELLPPELAQGMRVRRRRYVPRRPPPTPSFPRRFRNRQHPEAAAAYSLEVVTGA